jgi:5S rRNA maturation endonuclease (ribonuclease M5)
VDKPRYISVDEIQAQMTLTEAAAKCGVSLDVHGSGRQVRLDCAFGCPGDHRGKREISVDTTNPQKVFCCHAYECQLRGNLLALMHGWLTETRPAGDKLKGEEFKRVRGILAGDAAPLSARSARPATPAASLPTTEPARNIPLSESENEKAQGLETLDEKFLVEVSHMPPAAASYVRRHPCLSPALMQKWRVGVLPQDAGSDKRGWGLRGQLLYPILAENGKLLAWVSRDPQFETKDQAFATLPSEQRAKEKKPSKHRFPVDFHRGLELFGQQGSRLKETGYAEMLARCGVIVVEGFNDVLGLDAIGVPAVGIMSNKVTAEQIAKIERFAKSVAGGKVTLLFDTDEAGDNGAKETLWLLAQRGLDVRLGWSREMHGEIFKERQPENLKREEWEQVIAPSISR